MEKLESAQLVQEKTKRLWTHFSGVVAEESLVTEEKAQWVAFAAQVCEGPQQPVLITLVGGDWQIPGTLARQPSQKSRLWVQGKTLS